MFVGDDCSQGGGQEFDSLGHILLSDDTNCDGFDATGDLVNSNPKLGQLKNNGGPTQTVALKKGSPAIGAYERVKKKKKR